MSPKRRRNNRQSQKPVNQVQRLMHGISFRPPSVPPSVVYSPWYRIVLASTALANDKAGEPSFISTASFYTTLAQQIGLPADTSFSIRIEQMKVWLPQRGSMQPLNLGVDFYSLIKTASQTQNQHAGVLKRVEDMSTGMTSARVGYSWPEAHRSIPLLSTDSSLYVCAIQSNVAKALMDLHVHILWQVSTGNAIPPSSTQLELGVRRMFVDGDKL